MRKTILQKINEVFLTAQDQTKNAGSVNTSSITSRLKDLDILLTNYEKEYQSINKNLEKAKEENDTLSFAQQRDELMVVLGKLIKGYERKKDFYSELSQILKNEKEGKKPSDAFKNQEIQEVEFANLNIGQSLKVISDEFVIEIEKINEEYCSIKNHSLNIKSLSRNDLVKFEKFKLFEKSNIVFFRKTESGIVQIGTKDLEPTKMYKNI